MNEVKKDKLVYTINGVVLNSIKDVVGYIRDNIDNLTDIVPEDKIFKISTGLLGLMEFKEYLYRVKYVGVISELIADKLYLHPHGVFELEHNKDFDNTLINGGSKYRGLPLSSGHIMVYDGKKLLLHFKTDIL